MRERFVQIILKALVLTMVCLAFFLLAFLVKKGIQPFISGNQKLFQFFSGQSFFENNQYSIGFLIVNTIYIVLLSVILIFPVSFFIALYLISILGGKSRRGILSFLEVLQGIPSILFGVIGSIFLSSIIFSLGESIGISTKGGLGIFTSVLVLFLMGVPNCTLLIYQGFYEVDALYIESSLALGISKIKTYFSIISRKIFSSLFDALLFVIVRVLSESTVLSMIIGNRSKGIVFNLFETSSTMSSMMLIGLKESSGLNYEIRFSIALVLLGIIFFFNRLFFKLKGRIAYAAE